MLSESRIVRWAVLLGGLAAFLLPSAASAAATDCRFELGFAALHALIPSVVGNCLENEGHNPVNGDGLQQSTGGLLVWRKADNWTAFTDGYRTWINGPDGLQERLNSQRFPWEAQETPAASVNVLLDVSGSGAANTAIFNPESGYNLDWSYDCSKGGGSGLFTAFAKAPGDVLTGGSSGTQKAIQGQGTTHFSQGGPQYLNVIAYDGCTWHITVRG